MHRITRRVFRVTAVHGALRLVELLFRQQLRVARVPTVPFGRPFTREEEHDNAPGPARFRWPTEQARLFRRYRCMKTAIIGILAAVCVAATQATADTLTVRSRSVVLVQLEGAANPNALDGQDRLRDRVRERGHEDVKSRLGDKSPELQKDRGFTAPTTEQKPLPDARVETNQSR
jgi:hypothetical protein